MRWLHFQHWLKVLDIALSPRAISSITSAWVTKSIPWPPRSLGTTAVRKPSLEPFLMISQSKVSRGSEIMSRSSDMGATSSSANFLALSRHAICSSFKSKSM